MANEATVADFKHYEALYKQKPASCRRKVMSFIALGYGYVLTTVLIIDGFIDYCRSRRLPGLRLARRLLSLMCPEMHVFSYQQQKERR